MVPEEQTEEKGSRIYSIFQDIATSIAQRPTGANAATTRRAAVPPNLFFSLLPENRIQRFAEASRNGIPCGHTVLGSPYGVAKL